MNDILYEFKNLHYFQDSLTFGVNAVLDNWFKRNILSITPCFDALSYLCEYLLELLELSRSIWFSFYQ